MEILLIDVDSTIPNLALMKISTYYKALGYSVELVKLGLSWNKKKEPIKINALEYSKVFISVIFEINKNIVLIENNDNVSIGGVGSDNACLKLNKEIENCECDYSIYPENEFSFGFITRGCVRKCYFCKVHKTEGTLFFEKHPKDIIRHKKVKFMDNNFLAYDNHIEILEWLIENKIKCQFNQGLDIRLINDKNAELLSKLNYFGEYIFAFDDIKDMNLINEKIILIKKNISKDWKIKFYIYCNANMDIEKDVVPRINWCKQNKILPYVMRDINIYDSNNRNFYTDLSAYCNQPNFFKKMNFKDFLMKRHLLKSGINYSRVIESSKHLK